jgi:hypothetical protein
MTDIEKFRQYLDASHAAYCRNKKNGHVISKGTKRMKDKTKADIKWALTTALAILVPVLFFFGLAFGVSFLSGCSQEMGSRYEMEWLEDGPKVTYTEFKVNYFLYDRDWKNFNYKGLSFDQLKGESKDVDVDLLRKKVGTR